MGAPHGVHWAAGYRRSSAPPTSPLAQFTFLVHFHMLPHACGFKLANDRDDQFAKRL
jgi:hypothetical protein